MLFFCIYKYFITEAISDLEEMVMDSADSKKMFYVVGFEKLHEIMWNDIKQMDNALFIGQIYTSENKLLHFLKKIHLSNRLNRIIDLPGKKLWYKLYTLSNVNFEGRENYVILTDNRPDYFQKGYLEELKKEYSLHYVLVYLNPYSTSSKAVLEYKELCDYVFTYDKEDSEKYNFFHFENIYSMCGDISENDKIENDILFIGSENGRLDFLYQCFEWFEKEGLKTEFRITRVPKDKMKHKDKIIFNKPLPYEKVIERIKKSNCILEVINDQRTGTTIRPLEAICYGRKLLSNNKCLRALSAYDERYMKIFRNVEDIDIDFVTRKESVCYQYNGECSPCRIIEKLIKLTGNEN